MALLNGSIMRNAPDIFSEATITSRLTNTNGDPIAQEVQNNHGVINIMFRQKLNAQTPSGTAFSLPEGYRPGKNVSVLAFVRGATSGVFVPTFAMISPWGTCVYNATGETSEDIDLFLCYASFGAN